MTAGRLRLVFAALALALAIPGALLVARALESVAVERGARELAVAERVFDEMERLLSEQLAAEEARPASDYDFSSASSPLRERPADALAIGWFQIEADGQVTAPSWSTRAARLAEEIAREGVRLEPARSGPRASAKRGRAAPRAPAAAPPALAASHDAVAESAAPGAIEVAATGAAPAPAVAMRDATSAEIAAGSAAAPKPAETDAVESAASSLGETDAYAALSKLNTGAKDREERKQRVYVEAQRVAATATEPGEGGPVEERVQLSPAVAVSPERLHSEALVAEAIAADARKDFDQAVGEAVVEEFERFELAEELADGSEPASSAGQRAAEPGAGASDAGGAAPEAPVPDSRADLLAAVADAAPQGAESSASSDARELVRVVVDPMRGRLASSGELLLIRSAWIGARGVRQGLALERAALERALAARVLAQAELADAQLSVAAWRGVSETTATRRAFAHRFGEPFDALGAELSFAPLADEGAASVYWLAGLFALAGAGGLFAAYRTTATALHFAERRSNFAAAVSHELKTPLTAIRLYAEMLRDGLVAGDEKRREYYGSISAETERLSRLINNVLEFSKLERGTRSFELSVGDPAPVVREAVELLRPHAGAHGLTLDASLEDGLPPVRFERDALLQVVFNLVDNAVKYGRGGPARIEVACRREGDGVAIVVRDHGPGVPPEELTRILEPFYRRGDELTRSAPGAGIGLALVRSLAERMGAVLAVSNAPGGGLAIALTLARPARA